VLAFSLSTQSAWRRMAASAGFEVCDEGLFNGAWFAVLQRRDA